MNQPHRITAVPRVDRRKPVHTALWVIAGIAIGVELLSWLNDTGTLRTIPRQVLQMMFAFWDQRFNHFLETGVPGVQLLISLVSHGFLHGGWLHVGMNMAAFLGVGHAISQVAGIRASLVCFFLSVIAGAITLGLLSDITGPLVGASGGVFGLLGMLTAWEERALRLSGLSRRPVWSRIAGLVVLNIVLFIGLGGYVAWEAHLGGFLAGWAVAYLYPPVPHRGVPRSLGG